MLTKRIIACLDVRDGVVVKGVKFRDHVVLGDVLELAKRYRDQGADELVFYDITASAEKRVVDVGWIERTAALLDIPFCVAGGICTVEDAGRILHAGADKISVNSMAHERPQLVNDLAQRFGQQCVVVGLDSRRDDQGEFWTYKYTGKVATQAETRRKTTDWVQQVQSLGAGEIVLNCMDRDGTKAGYDLEQLSLVRKVCTLPLVASGGAGTHDDFARVFKDAGVDAALAAGILHREETTVGEIKAFLKERGLEVR